jgi:hypothetical protein
MEKQVAKVCVALNTPEVIVVTEVSNELLWLKRLTCDLVFKKDNYVLFCDNQSAIHLSKNETFIRAQTILRYAIIGLEMC